MTYSREKYINNDFDISDVKEVKIAQKIIKENLSGIKYNIFIKDYLIEKIREDLLDVNFFENPILGEMAYKIIPLLIIGMLDTVKKILLSFEIEDENLKLLVDNWIKILDEANDIPDIDPEQKSKVKKVL